MNLYFDKQLKNGYFSNAQIARRLTETWINENMFCPHCGNSKIEHFPNNTPVADFYCPSCLCEYELKSKANKLGSKIVDGAYDTMISRITSNNNPDFFFMTYSKTDWKVKDLLLIPKYFFVPDIIEKRKPLSDTSQRAGWIGCNIMINKIPEQGRIFIISDGTFQGEQKIIKQVNKSEKLKIENLKARGWLMDVLQCVNDIPTSFFTLSDVYHYELILAKKHPQNNNVKAKIRQQLQLLRDSGFIEFLGNGRYKKLV